MPQTQAQTFRSPKAARAFMRAIGGGLSMFDLDCDDAMGETDCPHGCVVESDGVCPHGYESAARTAGMI